ncbi:MAG: dTDP-4-dehydrorhamnose reductase [Candidatus Omnitrophica bacterium]|nr:dTDP-4-dehydrorhamnose reductase [Candidatus Omnitrophota bacterium]
MKVFITGSNGILGHALVRGLGGGTDITGFDYAPNSIAGLDFIRGDISSERDIQSAVEKVVPDFVIHCAAFTDVDGCEDARERAFQVNAEGTKNTLVAASKARSFFIFVSTDYVFDGKKAGAYTEQDSPNPISVYGASKLRGEEYLKAGTTPYLIVRTSWLFGLHGKNFVESVLRQAEAGKPLSVVGDQTGRPTYAKDLACALTMIVAKKSKGELPRSWENSAIHVANKNEVSWFEFAEEIVRLGGYNSIKLNKVDSLILKRKAPRPKNSVLSTEKFEGVFKDVLRPWQDALAEYMKERSLVRNES